MNLPVYLDYNSTTPLDPLVLEAMLPVLKEHFGNPASNTHAYGWYAEELVAIAREQVASLIGASTDEIVFTSSCTEANNLALKGAVRALQRKRPRETVRLASAVTEHRAVLDVLARLQKDGVVCDLLPVTVEGLLQQQDFSKLLAEPPDLFSLMYANNETGVLHVLPRIFQPLAEMATLLHCDAAQAVGKIPVNVKALGVDFLSFSAHKLYGPKGVGALYVAKRLGSHVIEPLIDGGGHEGGLRSGTLNVPAIVGFGVACELAKEKLSEDSERARQRIGQLFTALKAAWPSLELNGASNLRLPNTLNVFFPRIPSSKLISAVSSKVAISVTSACSSHKAEPSHVLLAMGFPRERAECSVRFSVGRFTSEEDISFASQCIIDSLRRCSS